MNRILLALVLMLSLLSGSFFYKSQSLEADLARVRPTLSDEARELIAADQSRSYLFTKFFLNRYYNYTSQTYLQNHLGLLSFVSDGLRERRQSEIDRLAVQIRDRESEQVATTILIRKLGLSSFSAVIKLERADTQELYIESILHLKSVGFSIGNTWGLEVERLDQKVLSKTQVEGMPGKTLFYSSDHYLALEVPCAVTGLLEMNANGIRLRTTSGEVSLIEVIFESQLRGVDSIGFDCGDRRFQFELVKKEGFATAFARIPRTYGVGVKRPGRVITKPVKKNKELKSIQNEIKSELGIEFISE